MENINEMSFNDLEKELIIIFDCLNKCEICFTGKIYLRKRAKAISNLLRKRSGK